MNAKRIDLNLLQIFYSIMTERNVTRAAERLAMTQPAVSNALARLRDLFQDELFTKVHGGVRPTARAMAVWPEIEDAISKIRAAVGATEFEPATSHQVFNVAITESLRYTLVPALAVHFAEHAPHVELHLQPHTNAYSIAALQSGQLDCAIGMFPQPPMDLHGETLLSDHFICVLRAENPLLRDRLTLKAFAKANHILVKPSGASSGVVDSWLRFNGLSRHISIVVNHFKEAIDIARETDLIATIPSELAWMVERTRCKAIKLPFPTEKILYKMLWNDRADTNNSQIWLRSVLRNIVKDRSKRPGNAKQPAVRKTA